MTFSRRSFLMATAANMLAGQMALAGSGTGFSRDWVIEQAAARASRAYSPRATVPQEWLDLTYEQYRLMWFRNSAALWSDTDRSYNVDFFHPGLYFPRPIRINTVEAGKAHIVPFELDKFDKTDKAPELPVDETLGYSGFRLRTELDQPGIKNEFCVFQGASYFRAIGIGDIYGLSARGLALNTADDRGEEFPDFVEFWMESPTPGQRNIVVHALLDSPSVTGAYRFDILPGANCVMEVEAALFPRVDLDHVGLGPLTSMFMFDQTNRNRFDDFRPAVHDNDGLMMRNGAGESIWRPLANPVNLQVSSFVDENPTGFGLMQRARAQHDYADFEALYHRRPGLWVEPQGTWGRGAVTLVEIPTDKEIYDNIVAYWRPAELLTANSRHDFAYRLTWGADPVSEPGLPRVTNTRMGKREAGGRVVTVDYEAHSLLEGDPSEYTLHISSPHAETSVGVLQRNLETGGLRLAFSFDPGERNLVELRAQLRKDGAMASEVWLYRWTA